MGAAPQRCPTLSLRRTGESTGFPSMRGVWGTNKGEVLAKGVDVRVQHVKHAESRDGFLKARQEVVGERRRPEKVLGSAEHRTAAGEPTGTA